MRDGGAVVALLDVRWSPRGYGYLPRLVVLLWCFFSSAAFAQGTCDPSEHGYTIHHALAVGGVGTLTSSPMWYPLPKDNNNRIASCHAWFAQHAVTVAEHTWNQVYHSDHQYENVNATSSSCSGTIKAWNSVSTGWFVTSVIGPNVVETDNACPPPPPECDQESPGIGEQFVSDGSGDYCHPVSNCLVRRGPTVCIGGSACMSTFTHTSDSCSPGQQTFDPPDSSEGCIESGGVEFCKTAADKTGNNCGWLNDEFVCLNNVGDDTCRAFGDGSRVCGGNAPTPPVPDSGDPGSPAPPDEQITAVGGNNVTTTVNYYNGGTVAGSARDAGDGGNPFTGAGPSGMGGTGDGEGGGGDGLMCDPETDEGCGEGGDGGDGDDPTSGWQCWAEGEGLSGAVAACFQTATRGLFESLVSESSLLSVVSDVIGAWPESGGTCPSEPYYFAFLDETIDFWEVPCSFLENVEDVLGPLFLILWSFLGLRILLTIPGGES